ncbi:hypothetical protein PYW08_006540 [Mythimna loreyi]|uniref:Uncharacterized protein n=1 Tax=Mythimna loreyi TaxID=667449 RepID=A0ACC2QN14_9NEOP|nr:hypothetical protein PYW08_006540 [Mythimna loreyi]
MEESETEEQQISDDVVDTMNSQTDEQTDMPFLHRLTPAHIFEDVDNDLHTWLTNDDKDSDRLITEMIKTDHLTFDWVQDHNTFQGKREKFRGVAGPTFPVTENTTPLDVFLKFFDDELLDLIIKQTNRYATRQIDRHLTPHSRLFPHNSHSAGFGPQSC